jgi:non-specific protein-tyrosine kinase
VLPSGLLPPNPSELLGSNRMVKLLAHLRDKYDVILIDAAPLLPVTDAAVVAPRVDGVLVLVRHGRTVLRDLQTAKDALDAVSGRILGSVMTMVPHAGSRAHARLKPQKGMPQPRPLGQVPTDQTTRDGRAASGGAGGGAAAQPVTVAPPAQQTDANGQVLDRGGSAAR